MEPNAETKVGVIWYKPGTREVDPARSEGLMPCPKDAVILVRGPTPPSVPLMTKAKHLRYEMTEWIKRGMKFVPREIRKARQSVCSVDDGSGKPCQFWNPKGNWGLGECRHGSCGCTRAKAALEGMACPLKKWAQ